MTKVAPMRRRLSLQAIGGFAVTSLFLIHAALAVDVAPPGSGFSAWFPVEPKESSEPTAGSGTRLWIATDQAYIFIVGREDNAKTSGSRSELEASLKGLMKEVDGRVLSQKMTTISRPGGRPLPALLFTFAGSKLSGSMIIIPESGRGTYSAMGAKFNDQNGDGIEIDRFMMSFKLTAKR
jgi:hypothetical protein